MSIPQTMYDPSLLEAALWPPFALFGLATSSHSWESLMLLQPFYITSSFLPFLLVQALIIEKQVLES